MDGTINESNLYSTFSVSLQNITSLGSNWNSRSITDLIINVRLVCVIISKMESELKSKLKKKIC